MKVLLCFSIIVQVTLPLVISEEYVVPQPHIKLLSPRGFRVSIPHVAGIELFAFHGNINKPMQGLEAGQFSKDILIQKNNKWVFEDRDSKLKPGDAIYYWLFVIKNRLGYRYDNGEYLVKAFSSTSTELSSGHISSSVGSTENEKNNRSRIDASCRCQLPHYILEKIEDMAAEVEQLRENSSVLQKLLEKEQFLSLEMKFEGILPPYDDASYAAQVIIDGKLGLRVAVVNATRNADNSITFRLASLDDKVAVIRTAKEALINSKIKLVY